jgi:asparagine synthase (glutamine-hydrolysing)
MCGICGVVQIGGEPRPVVSPEVLDRMTDLMSHRGPDDRGTYTADGVALGARRLSIVDVEGGHQPFSNEDGQVWAVLNGMIYNHNELRADLAAEGHAFRSRCDTEVLPHLYERTGPQFQHLLRGEFGLAVWDAKRRRAVVARDRLGAKPLYYAERRDLVVFASELKSLLASGLVGSELDYDAIDAYLALGFVPGPRTPLAGVSKLPPGHRLVVEPSGVRVERYWSYPLPSSGSPDRSGDEYARELIAQLEEAVRLRLMSDVPLGAMLSGGLDSSVVVALMARNMSQPVRTFSVGFADVDDSNELADARLVAEYFGTDHNELELSFVRDTVDLAELVWHLDEPLPDLSALGLLALSEFASRHVTVALSGMGPDELLAGYPSHRNAVFAGAWGRLPAPIRAIGEGLAGRGPARFRRAAGILGAPDEAARLLIMEEKLDRDLRDQLVRGPLRALDGDAARRAILARLDGITDDPLAAHLYVEGQLRMVDHMLHYIDRSSMARSLDLRAPFLDHRVIEFCAGVPNRFKFRGLTTKYLLKRAARGLVPDRVIEKRKVGFLHPAAEAWLRLQLPSAIADYLLDSRPRYADFLDRRRVEQLVDQHTQGRDSHLGSVLLAILMLEIWLSTYLGRALGSSPIERESVRIPA